MKTFLKIRVLASTMIAFILVCTTQHMASAQILWGVAIEHRAVTREGSTSNHVVYARDSLSTFFLVDDEYRGPLDYTLSPFSGLGELVLILEDGKLTVSYDLSLAFTQDGQAIGIDGRGVYAYVYITPYAPIGDEISISVSNNLTTSDFGVLRGDLINSPIVDIDLEGVSSFLTQGTIGGPGIIPGGPGLCASGETIIVDGVEYGQLRQNFQGGYTRFRVQRWINYNNDSPDATYIAKGIITVEARNLSSPACMLGDVDLSGVVDFADIAPFIAVLQGGTFQCEADCNEDEVVDFGDIPAFIAILQGS